jgi:hypothetical protein
MPWKRRWNYRAGMGLAVFFPGLPQMLRQQPRLAHGALFLLGSGSLLGLIGLLALLPIQGDPLESFFWISLPDLAEIYPIHLRPGIQAEGSAGPILAPSVPLIVRQPFFWRTFSLYCGIYALCAGISAWNHWKFGQVAS